jgi:hypothetical protein
MTKLTEDQKQALLQTMADDGGFEDVQEMLEASVCDSVCPAICTMSGCQSQFQMEPDCEAGLCEECGCDSVDSAMILAGLI